MTDIVPVDQRLKMQLGELLFTNHVAAAQIDTLHAENASLKAKIAEMDADAKAAAERADPPEAVA